jgi:receptor protein-tyrosine kinase
MSIIEKAVERLEQLQRAAGNGDTAERQEPSDQAPAVAPASTTLPSPVAAVTEQPASVVPAAAVSRAQSPDRFVEIDLDRLHSIGIVTPNAPRSLIGDEFRIVKRPLLRNVQGKGAAVKNANLIMVTSSFRVRARASVPSTSQSAWPWSWTTPCS